MLSLRRRTARRPHGVLPGLRCPRKRTVEPDAQAESPTPRPAEVPTTTRRNARVTGPATAPVELPNPSPIEPAPPAGADVLHPEPAEDLPPIYAEVSTQLLANAPTQAPVDDSPSEHEVAPSTPPDAEPFPDQITGRSPRVQDDRPPPAVAYRPPPPPLTYRPQPSAYVDGPPKTLMPLSTKNGPATTSLFFIILSLLGFAAARWWLTFASPAFLQLVNLISMALLVMAFVLAIAGLVVAVARPTKKRASVFALVVSSLLILGVVVLFALGLVAATPLDGAEVETTIEGWYLSDSGAVVTVACPVEPPSTDGSVFVCSATHDSGLVDVVEVTVQGDGVHLAGPHPVSASADILAS